MYLGRELDDLPDGFAGAQMDADGHAREPARRGGGLLVHVEAKVTGEVAQARAEGSVSKTCSR